MYQDLLRWHDWEDVSSWKKATLTSLLENFWLRIVVWYWLDCFCHSYRHWMDNQHDINGVESLMVLACEKAIESASLLLCGVFGILNGCSVLQLKAHSIRLNAKSTLRMSSQFELYHCTIAKPSNRTFSTNFLIDLLTCCFSVRILEVLMGALDGSVLFVNDRNSFATSFCSRAEEIIFSNNSVKRLRSATIIWSSLLHWSGSVG